MQVPGAGIQVPGTLKRKGIHSNGLRNGFVRELGAAAMVRGMLLNDQMNTCVHLIIYCAEVVF